MINNQQNIIPQDVIDSIFNIYTANTIVKEIYVSVNGKIYVKGIDENGNPYTMTLSRTVNTSKTNKEYK